MIRINLLPHREAKRKQLNNDFYSLLALAGIVGALVVIGVGGIFSARLAAQNERNNFIKAENDKLDKKIEEISTLKQEIDSLKARQQAVEDLQGDRNQPVYLLDELVKLTPEGVYLRSLKQDGQRVVLSGYAQSQERVSELLRNLGNKSPWMNKPELGEIKSAGIGQGRDAKKVYDFSVNVGIKRPRELEAAAASSASRPATGSNPAPASAPAGKS
jgi:type IV pilus assembly protein PilN